MPIAIQNRILLGITFFVGIMLLVGWIAINEPGRMTVFNDQYNGRSIENGAVIFLNNCATCHGPDGKGITGRAPGLVNPMLFLDKNPAQEAKAKVDDLQKQLDAGNQQISGLADNQKKLDALNAQIAAEPDATNKKDLQDQATKLKTAIDRIQNDLPQAQKALAALQTQLDQANADLKALTDQGWDVTRPPRLKELGWGGTLKQYVSNAVAAGRPVSSLYWPQAMPTWGQAYGGPMRPDEVDDVANYVLNWRDVAAKATPKDVNQQFVVPQQGGSSTAASAAPAVDPKEVIFTKIGKDPNNKVDAIGDLKGGDATKGEQLYTAYACAGCHLAGAVGPITKGTFYRAGTERLKAPENAGLSPEQYLATSILYPNAYIVPSYNAGVMPQNFGEKMDTTQLKDIIAYLSTFKTP